MLKSNKSVLGSEALSLLDEPLFIPEGASVQILGGNSAPSTLDAHGLGRLLDVRGRVELVNLHLTRGLAEMGGGISVSAGGSLILRNCVISE